jgi:hypothetical protein
MTVAVEYVSGGKDQGPQPSYAAPNADAVAAQQPHQSPDGSSLPASGNWHLRLANLMVTLRFCLLGPERDLFDRVHASAHKREIPPHYFFSFALDILRQHKPDLEDEFREVFRLRNMARRRAQQHHKKGGNMRSVKSESALQDCHTRRGKAMSRSCEDVPAQARTVEEVDDITFRVQGLSVEANLSNRGTVLTKRHSEISLSAVCEQKRKSCLGSPFSHSAVDILSSSPP